jgi:hypothetical protein
MDVMSMAPVNLTEEADSLMAELLEQAAALLDAAGYVIVPKHPTHEMVMEGLHPAIPGSVSEIYREMIKAAPTVAV